MGRGIGGGIWWTWRKSTGSYLFLPSPLLFSSKHLSPSFFFYFLFFIFFIPPFLSFIFSDPEKNYNLRCPYFFFFIFFLIFHNLCSWILLKEKAYWYTKFHTVKLSTYNERILFKLSENLWGKIVEMWVCGVRFVLSSWSFI